jgi:hypothetical protein
MCFDVIPNSCQELHDGTWSSRLGHTLSVYWSILMIWNLQNLGIKCLLLFGNFLPKPSKASFSRNDWQTHRASQAPQDLTQLHLLDVFLGPGSRTSKQLGSSSHVWAKKKTICWKPAAQQSVSCGHFCNPTWNNLLEPEMIRLPHMIHVKHFPRHEWLIAGSSWTCKGFRKIPEVLPCPCYVWGYQMSTPTPILNLLKVCQKRTRSLTNRLAHLSSPRQHHFKMLPKAHIHHLPVEEDHLSVCWKYCIWKTLLGPQMQKTGKPNWAEAA